jgi:hypothetical protein
MKCTINHLIFPFSKKVKERIKQRNCILAQVTLSNQVLQPQSVVSDASLLHRESEKIIQVTIASIISKKSQREDKTEKIE